MIADSHINPEELKQLIQKERKQVVPGYNLDDHSLVKARDNFELNYIFRHLDENDWNVRKTSEILEIDRTHLYKLMKKYDLKRSHYKSY